MLNQDQNSPGIPAIPVASFIIHGILLLLYGGIWGKVTEGTKSKGQATTLFNQHFATPLAPQKQPWPLMTNLSLSRPSKPQSQYIFYRVIGNRRNDYKHFNNCKTVRVDYFLNVIYLKKLLSSLKHCYFPSPRGGQCQITFLQYSPEFPRITFEEQDSLLLLPPRRFL